MPHISLDYIRYNNEPLQEYIAIVRQRDHHLLSLRLAGNQNENNIQHHKYILSHSESISIIEQIKLRFTEIGDRQYRNNLNNYFDFDLHNTGFVSYKHIGPLNCIQGFQDIENLDFEVGIVVSNNYHLSGQLEIALVYTHPMLHDTFTIFDKWSVSENKKLFSKISNTIQFEYDNFNHREDLLDQIAESAHSQYRKALDKLLHFINKANEFFIPENAILPVLLDIKNITRTRSSILANPARFEKLKREMHQLKRRIRGLVRHQNPISYLDFLLLISDKRYSQNDFIKVQEDLTSSMIYRDLLITVDSFRNEMAREEYEHEQIRAIRQIEDLIL
jgi:hypothetical protein